MVRISKKQKLIEALNSAKEAAKLALAADTTPDTGTCNFDSLVIRAGTSQMEIREDNTTLQSVTSKEIEEALIDAGLLGRKGTGKYWRGSWIISPPAYYQGHKRTLQVETMCNHLRSLGYRTTVYYQMD